MGNKLGQHGEAAASASPGDGLASAAVNSSNKISSKKSTSALEDTLDNDQVAEVPPPMDPIAPLPVTTTSTTSETHAGVPTDLEASLSKPNNRCDDTSASAKSVAATPVIPAHIGGSDSVEPHLQERTYRLQVCILKNVPRGV